MIRSTLGLKQWLRHGFNHEQLTQAIAGNFNKLQTNFSDFEKKEEYKKSPHFNKSKKDFKYSRMKLDKDLKN